MSHITIARFPPDFDNPELCGSCSGLTGCSDCYGTGLAGGTTAGHSDMRQTGTQMTEWRGCGGPWHGMGMGPRDTVAVAYDDIDGDDPQVVAFITGQDALDGAALRRLREALPNGWGFGIWTPALADTRGRTWMICARAKSDLKGVHQLNVAADTIAEAADKCREALG